MVASGELVKKTYVLSIFRPRQDLADDDEVHDKDPGIVDHDADLRELAAPRFARDLHGFSVRPNPKMGREQDKHL